MYNNIVLLNQGPKCFQRHNFGKNENWMEMKMYTFELKENNVVLKIQTSPPATSCETSHIFLNFSDTYLHYLGNCQPL